jgi:hypothetical protein
MSVAIFLGPTLPRAKARQLCDGAWHPPASMGDITHAVSRGATAIVLIDGFFGDRPSVWHKEILWALSRGIPVIGAASMGALRAAELKDFGMLGHGRIYEAFASGALTDDDHVAVLHGPAELDDLCLSDAMVDIAYALEILSTDGLLSSAEADLAKRVALATHFSERSLAAALSAAVGESWAERIASHASVPIGELGLKALDASSTFRSLPDLVACAKARAAIAPTFIATRTLRVLEPFGFPAL